MTATRSTSSSGARPPGYPWGWNPPGICDHFAVDLPAQPLPHTMYGVCKPLHYIALCSYLHYLEWPRLGPTEESRATFNATFAELAIVFELFSGLDLPATKRRAPDTVAPLVDRAQAFSSMLALATKYAAPPDPLRRGEEEASLLAGTGWSTPLRGYIPAAHSPLRRGDRVRAGAAIAVLPYLNMTFTLAYPPARVNRTAEWEALSRQKPRTAALGTTTAEAPLSPPTYPLTASQPTDWTCTPSAIVPPGVDKHHRLGTRPAGP